ncbi:MAG: metal transporter [Desulfobacteraceae bacterium]|nr:metal transporter [Desulfobacteraceae bacterium]
MFQNYFSPFEVMASQINAMQNLGISFTNYVNDFMTPTLVSANYLSMVEQTRLSNSPSPDTFQNYTELSDFSLDLFNKVVISNTKAIGDHCVQWSSEAFNAWFDTFFSDNGDKTINDFMEDQAIAADLIANVYPKAISDVESEFGFHFERGENIKVAETDRFTLYQVAPTDKKVKTLESGKPVIIIPPYVLGANILAFLPSENRSYAHSFANQGIPTYIRILKDISTTPAVQTMTGDDDASDTRIFCEKIVARHGKPVTVNGYCQGGFTAVCNVLSGELDGLTDALITCVSPMDGTRSTGLTGFLKSLPQRFNDLDYGTKTLPNGNKVADGKLMSWVYKLRSIEFESPVVAFLRDLAMAKKAAQNGKKFSKSACAINYWLGYEKRDLPLGITRISFDSFNIPVSQDGTLPIKLFGRSLNFKGIKEKNIKWLICYGEKDDLVEKESALAPLDYTEAEVSAFPKGHVAIATSWSSPKSACALHTSFGDKNYRGPVRFQLDMDNSLAEVSGYGLSN